MGGVRVVFLGLVRRGGGCFEGSMELAVEHLEKR